MQIPYARILGQTYATQDGPATLRTRRVEVGEGLVDGFGEFALQPGIAPPPLAVVADPATHAAAGERVARALTAAGIPHQLVVLEAPKADDSTLRALQARIPDDTAFLVACGSGTVNDLAKSAAWERGLRYGVVPTAASMNGYTSSISALTVEGVKRTLAARAPVWVYADLDVVRRAPPALAAAGFGDLLSKSTATADWRIAHHVAGAWWSDAPHGIVELAFEAVTRRAPGVRTGDPGALEALTHALVLSGLSMAVAGSSSPASGGEHLISHWWDMTAQARGRAPALHGAQVSVATLVAATLHEKLRARRPEPVRVGDREAWLAEVAARFGGPQGEAVAEEAAKLWLTQEQADQRQALLAERWDAILADAERYLLPAWQLRRLLEEAGAPTTLAAIGVSPAELVEALLHGREIRARYSVLHLAFDAGLLERLADECVADSGVLG